MALQAPGFDEWIAEGTQTYFGQLVPAVANAPSETLAADISRRIAALDKLALQHRTLLNTCASPLLRLPREIWMRILSSATSGQHVQRWVKLGHTCSVLREALLENRILWGDAVCSWPAGRHREELLERAGPSVPLSLVVNHQQDIQFTVSHLARARLIRATYPWFLQQFVNDEDHFSLPYLEEVNLSCYKYASSGPVVALQGPSKHVPQLERATLINVFWNVNSSRLTSLTLTWQSSERAYMPSQFFDLLRQNTQLNFLHLHNYIPDIPDAMLAEDVVELPFLHTLEVHDERERAIRLWRLLLVSTAADVLLDFHCAADATPSDLNYAELPFVHNSMFLKHHFRDRRPSVLEVTRDDFSESGLRKWGLGIIVSSYTIPTEVAGVAPEIKVTLRLRYRQCFRANHDLNSARETALRHICTNLNLFSVTDLIWSDALRMKNTLQWFSLLDQFRELEYLRVMWGTKVLYAALGSSWTGTRESDVKTTEGLPLLSPLLLPKLRVILVDVVNMTVTQGEHPTVADLSNMIQLRIASGSPLTEFRLHRVKVDSMTSKEEILPYFAEICSHFPECDFEILCRDDMPL